jgi:hypothetical protein
VAPYYPATRRCHPPPTHSRAQRNALGKAGEAGHVKAIRTSRVEKFAQLSVSDRGSGTPEEKLNEVFEPFFTRHGHGVVHRAHHYRSAPWADICKKSRSWRRVVPDQASASNRRRWIGRAHTRFDPIGLGALPSQLWQRFRRCRAGAAMMVWPEKRVFALWYFPAKEICCWYASVSTDCRSGAFLGGSIMTRQLFFRDHHNRHRSAPQLTGRSEGMVM